MKTILWNCFAVFRALFSCSISSRKRAVEPEGLLLVPTFGEGNHSPEENRTHPVMLHQ